MFCTLIWTVLHVIKDTFAIFGNRKILFIMQNASVCLSIIWLQGWGFSDEVSLCFDDLFHFPNQNRWDVSLLLQTTAKWIPRLTEQRLLANRNCLQHLDWQKITWWISGPEKVTVKPSLAFRPEPNSTSKWEMTLAHFSLMHFFLIIFYEFLLEHGLVVCSQKHLYFS